MLNDRLNATRPIAVSLKNAEKALNESLRQMGSLLVDVANARDAKGTRFDLDAGVAASEQIALASVSAVQSYKFMIAAHSHFAADRDNANLPSKAFGDFYCPNGASEAEAPTGLRVVGQ
jgi:hypothetical protein